jgi:hypothetical protein
LDWSHKTGFNAAQQARDWKDGAGIARSSNNGRIYIFVQVKDGGPAIMVSLLLTNQTRKYFDDAQTTSLSGREF